MTSLNIKIEIDSSMKDIPKINEMFLEIKESILKSEEINYLNKSNNLDLRKIEFKQRHKHY